MATNNNNGGVTVSGCYSPTTQSQYTLNTPTVTSSAWNTTATYNGFTKRMRPIVTDRVLPEYIGYYMLEQSIIGLHPMLELRFHI